MATALVAEIHRPARSLFHAEFGRIHSARHLPLLPSSNVTTDAPATVAGRHGPDLPARHATAGSISEHSAAEVYGALESSAPGLATARAASRLAALGPNELRAARRPPIIRKVLAQFTNLFALVLLIRRLRYHVRLLSDPVTPGYREPGAGRRHPGCGLAQRRDRVLPGVLSREDIRSAPGTGASHGQSAAGRRPGRHSRARHCPW